MKSVLSKSLKLHCFVSAIFPFLSIAACFPIALVGQKSMVPCWKYPIASLQTGALTIVGQNVYTVDNGNAVIALDRETGSIIWRAELGGQIDSQIATNGNSLIVVSRPESNSGIVSQSSIRALNADTGITNWITKLPASGAYSIRAYSDSVVALSSEETTMSIRSTNGKVLWTKAGNVLNDPLNSTAKSVLFKRDNAIELISLSEGGSEGRVKLNTTATTAAAQISERAIVVGDSKGRIEVRTIDADGVVWRYKTGGAIVALVPVGDEVIAASADNFLYSLSRDSGGINWKRRLPGRIGGLQLSGTDRAVVTTMGENTIYLVDLDEGRFIDQLVLGADSQVLGASVRGDETGITILTSLGVVTFGIECKTGKAAKPAAAFQNF